MKQGLVLFLLGLGFAGTIVAQRTAISGKVFYESTKPVREPLRFPIRSKTTEEIFSLGNLIRTIVTDFEGTPADATRTTITEIVGAHKNASVTIESGDYRYSKVGSGPWLRERWYFQHPPTESYSSFLDGYHCWRETRLVDSQNVTIFGSSARITLFQDDERFREDEYYFVGERLVRKVQTDRSVPARLLIRRITSTSEHDPNIKIETPIK